MKESVQAGLPPLALCGEADMYAQIDDALYFPQIELLDEIVHGYPNATFFLTFRSMEKWYHSITHWPPRKNGPYMRDRMIKFNITGSPTCGDGIEYNYRDCNGKDIPAIEEFSDWYCNHVQRVRDVVSRNPSHTLVEVDIEDLEIGQRMEDTFGIEKSCWGHVNANANIHPELNQSEVIISKFQQKQQRKEKMNATIADDQGEDDDEQEEDTNDSDEEDDDGLEAFDEADDDYATSEDTKDSKEDEDVASFFNQKCLKARRDTVMEFNNLPKPYINLGFPKMGTSSLHSFFKCGGLTSTHYSCGKKSEKCSLCTKHSVEAGLPPLALCGEADMYAQLDNGQYFPQIELLEEFIHGHPNATFFLTFRSMEKWYQSLRNWPPRQHGPHMNNRFRKLNITGLPAGQGKNLEELSDWYCKHVERVRGLVARHPSHTLVEVDIEDPDVGQRMEDMFGIEKSCWGHKNANAIMMTENMTQLGMVEMHKHYKEGETAEMKAQKEEENRIKRIKHLESLSPRRIKRRMKNGRWPEELAPKVP